MAPVTRVSREGAEFVVSYGAGKAARAKTLVNCAGAWGKVIAAQFGEPVPEEPLSPNMFVTAPVPYFLTANVGMVRGDVYLRQIARGNVIIGGGLGSGDVDRARARPISSVTTATARLVQMRQMSRGFKAWTVETNTEENRILRLLTQPAFRYECKSANVTDGALFAFVMGTDPEVIVLLEAIESEGVSRWNYAIARFTNSPLRVSYQKQEIWNCPVAEPYVGNIPYFIYWRVSRRNAVM